MKTIQAGVIGTGFIGPLHIEAVRRLGYVYVVALSDISLEVAKEKAQQYGIPQYYGDYQELLANPDIEVVHICTPNHLHYTMAKEALLAGKHVLCEKPLSLRVEESQELVSIAQKANLVTGLNFNNRYYPLTYEAKQLVQSGVLGKVLAVHGAVQQDWLFKDTDYSWRLEPEYTGDSRAVSDIGSHWFDLIEHITGEQVTEVSADFATFHPTRKKPLGKVETYSGKIEKQQDYEEVEINTEDYAGVAFHLSNGGHGLFQANQVAAGRKYRVSFEINGDKCSLFWESETPNQLWIGHRDGNNEIMIKDPALVSDTTRTLVGTPGGHTEGFPSSIKALMGKFYAYIAQGQQGSADFPTFEDGLREQQLVDTIVASAKSRSWQQV